MVEVLEESMSDFRTYRFGQFDVEQFGGWGVARGWRVLHNGAPVGLEASNEIAAIQLGLILSSLTKGQLLDFNNEALRILHERDAA